MPELAEVEWFRKQWDPGLKRRVTQVSLHPKARIFRGIDVAQLERTLTGARLVGSQARGKQMVFQFDTAWLGVHLGMTGKLSTEAADFTPGKHDHLVLHQKDHSLVFHDPRLFGRVLFHAGKDEPAWWRELPPEVLSEEFTNDYVASFLSRRKGAPIKAVLLMQERFPGIGNWMADEILWQARIHPAAKAGSLTAPEVAALWKTARTVCRDALKIIGKDWSDPPDSWLFNHRWEKGGSCPRCGLDLHRAEIGGRTTCWCAHCQQEKSGA